MFENTKAKEHLAIFRPFFWNIIRNAECAILFKAFYLRCDTAFEVGRRRPRLLFTEATAVVIIVNLHRGQSEALRELARPRPF